MKKHTKLYLDHFNLHGEPIPCEVCGGQAVDIHHIEPRGMGGSKSKDVISNLMAVCRSCHEKCEHGGISREEQREIHEKLINPNKSINISAWK